MGSAFYTLEETANRLNRCKRSVWGYIKKGFLKKEVHAGNVVLLKEDVEQLAVSLGTDFPSLNRQTFFNLQSRLKKIEEEMITVKTILEIRDSPLRPDPKIARGIYEAIVHYTTVVNINGISHSSVPTVTEETVDHWIDIYSRIDEKTLDLIVKATLVPDAWKSLLDWCTKLESYCLEQDLKKASLIWQARIQKLSHGRKKLRDAIIIWLESGKGTIPSLIDSLDSNQDVLCRRLAKKI